MIDALEPVFLITGAAVPPLGASVALVTMSVATYYFFSGYFW
tara:strand:+ start:5567 stop:5692 length:126 start_codon:yes stop_codon:yes gene_type:complete